VESFSVRFRDSENLDIFSSEILAPVLKEPIDFQDLGNTISVNLDAIKGSPNGMNLKGI
jgi:hypothetical protein